MATTVNGEKWTAKYPELGTDPVAIEPCVSPEYFERERERIFRRWNRLSPASLLNISNANAGAPSAASGSMSVVNRFHGRASTRQRSGRVSELIYFFMFPFEGHVDPVTFPG